MQTGLTSTVRAALANLSDKDADRAKRPPKKDKKVPIARSCEDRENIPESTIFLMPNDGDDGHESNADENVQMKKRKLLGEEKYPHSSFNHFQCEALILDM